MDKKVEKIVLAYSGGLDTSVILHWLKDTYQAEVIAYVADLGQGEELTPLEERAFNGGASEIHIEDVTEEFVSEYIFPMFRAGAIYEGSYLMGTSIARPLIASKQMSLAANLGADAVAHGATGKGNDQVRFEFTYLALNPEIKIIAPWKIWDFRSRQDLVDYAQKYNIPVPVTVEKPYSSDRNLLHISFEGGILEDPWREPDPEMFVLTTSPEAAPDEPEYIEIDFIDGDPRAINGVSMSPAALLAELNLLGGRHGIGRVDMVENRYVGMKSRGVYETPGGTILYHAHRAMESLTMDREVMHLRDSLIPRYAELVYYGYWFAPERLVLQELMDASQRGITGTVRLKLYKGNVIVAGRKSPKSLYVTDFATFEADTVYDQKDADGFIKLNALRLIIKALTGNK